MPVSGENEYPVGTNSFGSSMFVPPVVSVGSVVADSDGAGSPVGSLEEDAPSDVAASVGADSLGTVTLALGAACCPQDESARISIERAIKREISFFIKWILA
ncbi:MAG: hypothetical protein IJQ37_00730 [Clostridia bacterium]|nr:hypothetical protein [Clostridia bacterium]